MCVSDEVYTEFKIKLKDYLYYYLSSILNFSCLNIAEKLSGRVIEYYLNPTNPNNLTLITHPCNYFTNVTYNVTNDIFLMSLPTSDIQENRVISDIILQINRKLNFRTLMIT